MEPVSARIAAEITLARGTSDGHSVVFGLRDFVGEEFRFALSPTLTLEAVGQLLSAHAETMANAEQPPAAILPLGFEVANQEQKALLSFALTPFSRLAFLLSPEEAEELSLALALLVAEIRGPAPVHH